MIKLVKLEEKYKKQLFEMMDEWTATGEKIVPYAIVRNDYHDFNLYMENIEAKVENEGRVVDSTYFALDTDRDIFVGAVNIRHYLNERLLKDIGHIGDGIRPSERRKGYATEMIGLALEKCKELGIDRALMVCNKNNIASAKTIMNNGGILENEIISEDGEIDQRYWITLKKRYAGDHMHRKTKKLEEKVLSVDDDTFDGDIYFYKVIEIGTKMFIPNGKCIMDNDYKWLEFYDYNSKVKLTAIYDENNKIVEWYFDIARKIGKDNDIAFEDDLYLDVVVNVDGEVTLIDEEDLKAALNRLEITDKEYEVAYSEAKHLIERLEEEKIELQSFTDKYLNLMIKND